MLPNRPNGASALGTEYTKANVQEFRRLRILVAGLVIFERLPGTQAILGDQQHEYLALVCQRTFQRDGQMARSSNPLIRSYQEANYVAFAGSQEITLRVGRRDALVDRLLVRMHASTAENEPSGGGRTNQITPLRLHRGRWG
jgi:hypothetical protein